jgi:hypothetical protein
MSNFKVIYEERLYEEFEALLHPDFRCVLLDATIEDWQNSANPLSRYYFDRDMTLQIHQNVFSNGAGTNEIGDPVDPIESIQIRVLEKIGSWTLVNSSNENFADQGPILVAIKL